MKVADRVNPVVARRRYVRQTAYLLVAIVLAIVGQGYLANRESGSVSTGLALFALAVLLTTRVSGSLFSADVNADVKSPVDGKSASAGWLPARLRKQDVTTVAGAALVCAVVELEIFGHGDGVILNVAWLAYVASLVLAIAAAWRLDRPVLGRLRQWSRRDSAILVAILAIAAFYRLWHIGIEPAGLWYDEAAHGLDVLKIMSDPTYRPIYIQGLAPEPALHWYFVAIPFVLFGPTMVALRISAILAGIVAVAGLFFLARLLFGWRTGVVAGAFLAVASWHVNFSRVMFDAIWSVTLDVLAAYFLMAGLRTGRYRSFAFAGLCLGLGLNIYYTSFLFVGVVAIFLIVRIADGGRRFLEQSIGGIILLGALLLLAGAPILEFAVLHPEQFNGRVAQVSVFDEVNQAHSLAPLLDSLQRHVVMFNYIGDPNGRHNLSGSPELDQVMAGLFVVGLALAIRRFRSPPFFLPLVWLPVVLAAGVFSLSYEAPQSLRTIDNSVVTVLFAAIPLGALWARLSWAQLGTLRLPAAVGGPTVISAGAVLALVLFGWSATLDYHKYFVLQADDGRTWAEYSSAQTRIGEALDRLDVANTDVYLGAIYLGDPSIKFLAPKFNLDNATMFDAAKDLPFNSRRAVAVFLPSTDDRTVGAIQRYYPNATVIAYGAPSGDPVLYEIEVSAADVAALHGLEADYFPGLEAGGTPTKSIRNVAVNFDQAQTEAPIAAPYTVSLHGIVAAPQFGSYFLKLQGPANSQVFIDENPVVKGTEEKAVTLAEGVHSIRVNASIDSPGPLELLWRTPAATQYVPVPTEKLFGPPAARRGLEGQYFAGPNWQGPPRKEQIDPALQLDFHILPLPRPYSAEWTGKIDIPITGAYTFGTDSIDSSWVSIDNQLIATNQGNSDRYAQGAVRLTEGLHDIQVKFQDLTAFSYITVYWQPPGAQREVIPSDRFFPPQGAYPDRDGPFTPFQIKLLNSVTAARTGATGPTTSTPGGAVPTAALAAAAIGPLTPSPLHQLRTIGAPGTSPGALKSPRGVAVDSQGNVYVVDADNTRVVKFDSNGKFVLAWGTKGDGQDQFQEPVDVAIDPKGQVDVLDSTTAWLKVFTPDGKFVAEYGGPSLSAYHPRGLALDASGDFFIADAGNARVVELSPTGQVITSFGQRGTGPGQIAEPVGIAIGSDGSVYVADTAANRLSHFDPSFHLIQSWPLPTSASVVGPHILVAPDQSVYVTDPSGQRVIHFSVTGQPIDQLGAAGQLRRPVGIRADSNGNIYVADNDAGDVVEFAVS